MLSISKNKTAVRVNQFKGLIDAVNEAHVFIEDLSNKETEFLKLDKNIRSGNVKLDSIHGKISDANTSLDQVIKERDKQTALMVEDRAEQAKLADIEEEERASSKKLDKLNAQLKALVTKLTGE